MVSAFVNTLKIPELRRRILFTLAVIVIVRLGAAITTPGVNQAVIQEWFRTALTEKTGRQIAAWNRSLTLCSSFAKTYPVRYRSVIPRLPVSFTVIVSSGNPPWP